MHRSGGSERCHRRATDRSMKAQFSASAAACIRPTPGGDFLERIDFSLPKYRGLFGEGYMRGLLLLMAAGSLPSQCDAIPCAS